MNVCIFTTKAYENFIPLAGQKNKPNSNPNKPNFQKAQMNINSLITKDYRKKDDFAVRINKPNPSGLRCLLRSCRTDQTQFYLPPKGVKQKPEVGCLFSVFGPLFRMKPKLLNFRRKIRKKPVKTEISPN